MLITIIEDRQEMTNKLISEENAKVKAEELERINKEKEKDQAYELERLRLQIEAQKTVERNPFTEVVPCKPKYELKSLLPVFKPEDDISLFLNLFERQAKFLKIEENQWVTHLVGVLPGDIVKLIAREPNEKAEDYPYIKDLLLKRFKLSAEKFRQLFSSQRKSPESTWTDFYFELRNYFENWLAELKIDTFDKLQNLMIADQIKKRCPGDFKDHFLDEWGDITSPVDLVEKLDAYENLRANSFRREEGKKLRQEKFKEKQHVPQFKPPNSRMYSTSNKQENSETSSSIYCYGCGTPNVIKSNCPTCLAKKKTSIRYNRIDLNSLKSSMQAAILEVEINGMVGTVCADTAATHSMAGEILYRLLQEQGVKFDSKILSVTLADGSSRDENVLYAQVEINVKGRCFPLTLNVLPEAKGNHTLLGIDFLKTSGVVLNLKDQTWHFSNRPNKSFKFVEEAQVQSCTIEEEEEAIPATSSVLRPDEGGNLDENQRMRLNSLLNQYSAVFEPGEESTPILKHHINTGDHPPVSVPPYRLSPARKEILKKEIDTLLENNIIEECESAYGAPVVLVPKPDGNFRLCVDYRQLNKVTIPDTYPLPRMDDILHNTKSTEFMSTLDLKSGYHQVSVNPADKDKTTFVCSFGTFRFKRMPFGLKNAPATFQRLMDIFCRGLPASAYLDDVIVFSDSFEQHLKDLEAVFKKLMNFKLSANRDKCHFSCSRVKYLGVWITNKGLEVDPGKVSAILKIPYPSNVKQLKSFLQTASWYRKFIPNFAKMSQPLSNLTKKNIPFTWGDREKEAFDLLKQCLVSPPILKQADMTKPFILRTDASNYALGAVLSQGEDYDEHPIEFASRLLIPAERNYSTTEREALAVVWALEKFRGYVEGAAIKVATDHQPLKWLLSLKSPTGRLARWALQIQSYNLNIEYVPGKSNVVADMLSRPYCQHYEGTCEICTIVIDMPTRSPSEIRAEQQKDENLKKIIDSFEQIEKDENFANFSDRGYLMNQGVLYRYSPESDSEEAQLVVPEQERERVLKEFHDAPEAGHYGAEGTFNRISKRYYWVGMRRYITDYVKNCADCCRYKASNQKPSGLLQTPIYAQRFETISIDLFGPLPETQNGKKWVFIIEDCATRWTEVFALANATARECAITLIEEIFTRYGLPRRVIMDNGPQFVSAVMQQVCYLLNIHQSPTPVYHPQANPVERKNRDLKPRIAILVGDKHNTWDQKLPAIRFALNTAKSDSTGQTPAYLQFGRELRTVDDISHDFRAIVENDNFVPEITPYLKRFANFTKQVRDNIEKKQDRYKQYADSKRKPSPKFKMGDSVWVTLHPISQAKKGKTAKFMPRRDGPYIILSQKSPTSFIVAPKSNPSFPIGTYHVSALSHCSARSATPVAEIRRRGRPKKPPPEQPAADRGSPPEPPVSQRKQPPRSAAYHTRTYCGKLRGRLSQNI